MTQPQPNSRAHGFSLRTALFFQGVTSEEAMRKHLDFVYNTTRASKALDITRYRVNDKDPSRLPDMG